MRKLQNNLDERQENVLLNIEMRGCWLAFWGLLIAMLVQVFLPGFESKQIAGERIVFMVLALYIGWACNKNGIWDRHLKPNPKTNALCSLVAGLVVGVLNFALVLRRVPDKPIGAAAAGIFTGVLAFSICFGVLSITAHNYNKKMQKMEEEPDEE